VIDAVGWLGAGLLALCGLPLLLGTKAGDRWFLDLWLAGEVAMFFYVLDRTPDAWPLLANYAFNSALVGVVRWRRAAH
jgi:hypothetical protein